MSDKKPKVSVIMPVYNQAEYLKQAIKSILNQTFQDFELIIINDGSTDQTADILNKFRRRDLRIKVFHQKNQGCTKSLNYGIKQARGEYIARQDADDVSLPERLQKQVEFLNKNKSIGLMGSFAQVIDKQGNKKKKILGKYTDDKDLRKNSFWSDRFCHSTIMVREELLKQINGYDENFVCSQDTDLYFRLMPHTQLANLSEILLFYREHGQSISKDQRRKQERFAKQARRQAIKAGLYPKYYILFLHLIPINKYLPNWIKKPVRNFLNFFLK